MPLLKWCFFLFLVSYSSFSPKTGLIPFASGQESAPVMAQKKLKESPSQTLGSHLVDMQFPGNLLLSIYRTEAGSTANGWPFNKVFSIVCVLSRGVGPLNLKSFDLSMPEHAHGMITKPSVEKVGQNMFRVDGLKLHMRGKWQLSVSIQSGASKPLTESLTLQL